MCANTRLEVILTAGTIRDLSTQDSVYKNSPEQQWHEWGIYNLHTSALRVEQAQVTRVCLLGIPHAGSVRSQLFSFMYQDFKIPFPRLGSWLDFKVLRRILAAQTAEADDTPMRLSVYTIYAYCASSARSAGNGTSVCLCCLIYKGWIWRCVCVLYVGIHVST